MSIVHSGPLQQNLRTPKSGSSGGLNIRVVATVVPAYSRTRNHGTRIPSGCELGASNIASVRSDKIRLGILENSSSLNRAKSGVGAQGAEAPIVIGHSYQAFKPSSTLNFIFHLAAFTPPPALHSSQSKAIIQIFATSGHLPLYLPGLLAKFVVLSSRSPGPFDVGRKPCAIRAHGRMVSGG